MSEKAPFVHTIMETVPGQATAGTDDAWNIGRAPFAGTVTACSYTPEAAITEDATNFRVFNLVNKGAAGAGTTVVATYSTDADVDGTMAADDEAALTLSAVEGATTVAEGDILEWQSDAVASGVADPGGLVRVTISRS